MVTCTGTSGLYTWSEPPHFPPFVPALQMLVLWSSCSERDNRPHRLSKAPLRMASECTKGTKSTSSRTMFLFAPEVGRCICTVSEWLSHGSGVSGAIVGGDHAIQSPLDRLVWCFWLVRRARNPGYSWHRFCLPPKPPPPFVSSKYGLWCFASIGQWAHRTR